MWQIIFMLTILSGVFYRLGGWGGEGRKKYPSAPAWLFDTKARDIGCTLCCWAGMITLFGLGIPWYIHLASFLMLFGSLTTYWDFLFGYDNHYIHGLACGVAYFPYAIISGDWVGFAVRAVALAVSMGLISQLSGDDVIEEVGRGAVLPATLPILLF